MSYNRHDKHDDTERDSETITETVISIGSAASGTSITNHSERRGLGERRQTQSAAMPYGERRGRRDRRLEVIYEQRCQDIPNHLNLLDHGGTLTKKKRRRRQLLLAGGILGSLNSGFLASILGILLCFTGLGGALMGYFNKAILAFKPATQLLQPLLDMARAQGLSPQLFGQMLGQQLLRHNPLKRALHCAAFTLFGRGAGGFWAGMASFAVLGFDGIHWAQQALALGNGALCMSVGIQQALPQIQHYLYNFSPKQLDTRIVEAVQLLERQPHLDYRSPLHTLMPQAQHLAQNLARDNHIQEAAAALTHKDYQQFAHPAQKTAAPDPRQEDRRNTPHQERQLFEPVKNTEKQTISLRNESTAPADETPAPESARPEAATDSPQHAAPEKNAHNYMPHQHNAKHTAPSDLPRFAAQLTSSLRAEMAARLNNYDAGQRAALSAHAGDAYSAVHSHYASGKSVAAAVSALDARLDYAESIMLSEMETFAKAVYGPEKESQKS